MKQTRFIPIEECNLQVREDANGQPSRTVVGHPIVYGVRSVNLTPWSDTRVVFEILEPGCITQDVFDRSDVIYNNNHSTRIEDMIGRCYKGKGTLNVNGNYKHGINSDDDIIIENGVINITSVKDGLHANDDITLSGKNIKLTTDSDGDSMESDGTINIEKANLDLDSEGKGIKAAGDITLTSGTYKINSTSDDCINGNTVVNIIDGTYTLTAGDEAITGDTINISGGSFNATVKGKGIKATTDMNITGGTYTLNTTDDSVHSNGNITIDGGEFTITSGDDGIHADTTVTIKSGTIDILKSYEGVEGNFVVIDGGTISVVASDDGVNAAGGNDQSSQGGRPGQNPFNPGGSTSNASITVNGGYLYVIASGDGVDSNGSLSFNGGTTIVQGPTTGGNFALDADGTVNFNGGTVMAIASSNAMWEDMNGKSGNAVLNKSVGTISSGSTIAVTDASGNVLSVLKPKISGSVGVVYYTNRTSSLTSCKAVVNGTYSGTLDSFGYSESGTVSGGTSSTLSTGSSSGGGPGGPGGRW